jgi:hypothetical protein
MAPLTHSTTRCPCCGLAHDRIEVFATQGKTVKFWYICPEFGQRVRAAIASEEEPESQVEN